MRNPINPQPNLREPWLELEHARELETILVAARCPS